ncbi:hypothetical protein GGR53DRAFT_499791 [Hypoxylon sp. FL1150]|nr:hypothetical protein GGR53DRAFT_499791 [Hypoxylon sp. FL1150]
MKLIKIATWHQKSERWGERRCSCFQKTNKKLNSILGCHFFCRHFSFSLHARYHTKNTFVARDANGRAQDEGSSQRTNILTHLVVWEPVPCVRPYRDPVYEEKKKNKIEMTSILTQKRKPFPVQSRQFSYFSISLELVPIVQLKEVKEKENKTNLFFMTLTDAAMQITHARRTPRTSILNNRKELGYPASPVGGHWNLFSIHTPSIGGTIAEETKIVIMRCRQTGLMAYPVRNTACDIGVTLCRKVIYLIGISTDWTGMRCGSSSGLRKLGKEL